MESKKSYSLHDRLTMQQTHTLNVGDVINIDHVDAVVTYTDSKTKQERRAVVVCDDNGAKYYLPNTIAGAYLDMVDGGDESEAKAELEGHTFRCEEFVAKQYGTKGKTLALMA